MSLILESSVKEGLARMDKELEANNLEIQAIQARIDAAYKDMTAARSAREELTDRRFALAAEIAPIKKLPYELLSTIFLLANEKEDEAEYCDWPGGDDEVWYPHSRPKPLPLVVSHVNRRFREVALTTGLLWADVSVGVKSKAPYHYARMSMDRAKDVSLDVAAMLCSNQHYSLRTGPYSKQPREAATIIKLLQPPARWRSFTLTVDGYEAMHAALLCCRTAAPQLRQLTLIDGPRRLPRRKRVWNGMKKPVDIFAGVAPRLSSITLRGVHVPWPMLSGLMELELVHHVREVRPTIEEYLEMLRASPGLKKLVVVASGPRLGQAAHVVTTPFDTPAVTIQLDALEMLEIGALPSTSITYILSSLSAPFLKAVSLRTWENADDYTYALGLINETRFPALRQLKLFHVTSPTIDLLALIQRFPNLEQLEIYEDDLLNKLIKSDRDPLRAGSPLVPKLRCLRASRVTHDSVIAFLRARKDLGIALDRMLMDRSEDPDEDTEDAIRKLVTFGFFRAMAGYEDDYTHYTHGDGDEALFEDDEPTIEDELDLENDDSWW